MSGYAISAVLSLWISALNFANGARILAICPTVSISHQVVLRGLTIALHKRGHELVVVTSNPLNDPNLRNYTEIDFSYYYKEPSFSDVNFVETRGTQSMNAFLTELAPLHHGQTEEMLNHPELRKLYAPNSNETFDLILLEMLVWHAFLPLGTRFNAPIIGK